MEDISHGLECNPIPLEIGNQKSLFAKFLANFRYVTRNIPGPGISRKVFQEQLRGCDCHHGCQQETCYCLKLFHPNYHPLSKQLSLDAVISLNLKPVLECNTECACDANCFNRLVQHGPRVKLKVAPVGSKGLGLFVCEDVKQLMFVCEYAGEVISVSEARKRLGNNDDMNYLIVLREHCSSGIILTCVDPQFFGNVGRFINHSCDPNLVMIPVRVDNTVPKLALFTRRDIFADEELSFDYSGETLLDCAGSSFVPGNDSGTSGSETLVQTLNLINHVKCNHTKTEVHSVSNEMTTHISSDDRYELKKTGNMEEVLKTGLLKDSGPAYTESDYLGKRSTVKDCICDNSQRIAKNHSSIQNNASKLKSDEDVAICSFICNPLPPVQNEPADLTGHGNDQTVKHGGKNKSDCTQHSVNYFKKLDYGKHFAFGLSYHDNMDSNTCSGKLRKRKLSDSSKHCYCDDGITGEESKSKHVVPPNAIPASQKLCLCGSSSCKGYLPFDRFILNSTFSGQNE